MNLDQTFSVAIFKKQLPECCTPMDVVLACQAQYGGHLIDMIQPINGLYRIDFKKREPQTHILAKGLSILSLTIPTTLWREGMDSPQIRLLLGPIPKAISDEALSHALKEIGLSPSSPTQPDFWFDKNSGKKTNIKTGKRVVFVPKTKTPIPDMVMVEENEVPIWYWGKNNKQPPNQGNGNIFKKYQKNDNGKKDELQNDKQTNQPISSSNLSDEDIVEPTPPVHPMFKAPAQKKKEAGDEKQRGRPRSRSASRKRSLSRGKFESPSKAKPTPEKMSQPSASINSENLFPLSPEEASGKYRKDA